jgi:MinD-like ATPase involved in chromosome partitioning or flagellar assembly
VARQNRDDPHSLEEQLAWLDAIKEREDAPTELDIASDTAVSPYPKDPWLAASADPAPRPPLFRAVTQGRFDPSPVAESGDATISDTAEIGNAFTTKPVKSERSGSVGSAASATPASRAEENAADTRPAGPSATEPAGPAAEPGDTSREETGKADPDEPTSTFTGPFSLGSFTFAGPAAAASDKDDTAYGTADAGPSRPGDAADPADQTTSPLGGRSVGAFADSLPKPDKNDPLGLGFLTDKRRDDAYTPGSLGAFGPGVPPFPTPSSSATAGAASDSETTTKEPVRGWLEPAVPATPADEDDEEQKRFDAFMAGGTRDRDTGPRSEYGGARDQDPAPRAEFGTPADTDPTRDLRRTGGPITSPRPSLEELRESFREPLSDPRPATASSAAYTDPNLRPPGDAGREPAAPGFGTGPLTPPRGDLGSGRSDTGPQVSPFAGFGPFPPPAPGDSGPHAIPATEPAAAPSAPGAAVPSPAAESAVPPRAAAEAGEQQERRGSRSHRRPIPQQPFGRPPRSADPARPSADSLDPQVLLKGRRNVPASGWRRFVYKATGGWIKPGEPAEVRRRRELMTRARTPVAGGHHRVAVLSLKGGVGKTTTTVGLGATLAQVRGDRVIAVDANPDRGTLSDKVVLETSATVRDLLNERDQVQRYADIRAFTSQAPSRLEILASDRDPSISEAFSAEDYKIIAGLLENFYSICITDCGTGLLHSAMSGVLQLADQIVLVTSPSVDGARAASATLDWLEAHEYGDLVKSATVVICSVRPRSKSTIDLDRLEAHFAARCRSVIRVPYDPHLEEGAEIDLDLLQPATLDAYLCLAAAVGDGFATPRT